MLWIFESKASIAECRVAEVLTAINAVVKPLTIYAV
jgi:hypothetical protein